MAGRLGIHESGDTGEARAEQRLDENKRPVTAIALMSGGLDSRLAARIMLEHGVRVVALNFESVFCHGPSGGSRMSEAAKACQALSIPLDTIPFSDELIPLVKEPPHGHGKHMNPCIDCRIAQLRLAKRHMDELGAHFLVTGEVVGQRPMSQRRDALHLIEREAGVKELVLRPLSAKLLPPTVAEQQGWVDRDGLYGFSGRSRKPQIELAARLGVTDYPEAAGGCLLTYEGFAKKVRELIGHKAGATERDFDLLKLGRHYRLPSGAKAIVSRDEHENDRLAAMAQQGDVLFERNDTLGPVVMLCDSCSEDDGNLAAALCVSHSKLGGASTGQVRYYDVGGGGHVARTEAKPLDNATLSAMRI